MPHSSGFIEKCVEFLLDPEVRKLSLAHRVEFLETKVSIQCIYKQNK
jgi:hypothetical protein